MEYLALTRHEAKSRIESADSSPVDKITIAAAITRDTGTGRQILLLKRNPDEEYFPNVFEMPGDKVDDTDKTIREAVVREVAEETQLVVSSIVSALPIIRYTTEKVKTRNSTGQSYLVVRHAIQLSYAVTVEGDSPSFRVNELEHSTGIWADAGMVGDIRSPPR